MRSSMQDERGRTHEMVKQMTFTYREMERKLMEKIKEMETEVESQEQEKRRLKLEI